MMKKICIFVMMMLITIASFQVIGIKSYIEKTLEANNFDWVKHGAISNYNRTRHIQDVDLRHFIVSNFGNNYQSMILAFTQCYCGNFIDDFQYNPRTTTLSGNLPDLPTVYGCYHRGLAMNLRPGITTQDAHDAARKPPHATFFETPQHVGPATMIGGTDDTYILVWASDPTDLADCLNPAFRHVEDDWDDLYDITNNFTSANITVLWGDGLGHVNHSSAPIDGPATWENMENYFVNLGSVIDSNDQFILFVTDHGLIKGVNEEVSFFEDVWENVVPIDPSLLKLIEEDREHTPFLKIFTPSEYADDYLEWDAYINDKPLGGYERYECDNNGNQIIEENEGIEYIFNIDIDYLDEEGNNTVKIYSYNDFTVYNTSIGIGTGLIRRRVLPVTPTVDGTTSGKPGKNYDYTFVSKSHDDYDLSYYIEWGDGTSTNWTEFLPSGESYTESHAWISKGTYIIKAKVKDIYGIESKWGSLEVNIPRYNPSNFNFNLLNCLFERFPLLERLLSFFRVI